MKNYFKKLPLKHSFYFVLFIALIQLTGCGNGEKSTLEETTLAAEENTVQTNRTEQIKTAK